ncbi:hypothetical protein [Actinocorallia populi]|uniref:hypothetical protein n=1 Tax=Actinocorallia populi TaxID=2079200 RepID=UPI000D0918FD|nr:hypothetical protein [Actinocorallia populi]
MVATAPSGTRPRNRLARLGLATVFWALLWIPAGVLSTVVKRTIEPARLFPDSYLISDSITGLPYLLPVVALAVVLPSIAYRRRDAFFFLIPFWNIAFSGVVCWRLAGLPHVDWPLRRA